MEFEKIIDFKRSFMQSFTSIGPFLDIAAIFAAIAIFSSFMLPIVVLFSFLISYSTIYTIYYISRKHSTNGGYYSFVGKSLGSNVGLIVGIFYIFYSSLVLPNISLFAANFITSALGSLSISIPFSSDIYAIVFSLMAVLMVSRGLRFSSTYTLILGLVEIIAILFYITFFFTFSVGGINIFQNSSFQSFFTGVMFGMVIFAGAGSSIFVSENTIEPRRLVPRAIILSYTFSGIALVVSAFAMENYLGSTGMIMYSSTGGAYILEALYNYNVWLFTTFLLLAVVSGFNLAVSYLRAFVNVMQRMRKDRIIPSWNRKLKDSTLDLFCIFCLNLAVVFVSNFYGFLTVFIIILTCVALSYIIVHIVTAIAVMRSCGFDPKNVGTPVSFISMVILGIVLYYEAIFNGNFYSNLITLLMVIGSFVTLLFLNVFRRNYLSKVEFEQAI